MSLIKKILIVGAGFCGTLVASQLLKKWGSDFPAEIILVERAERVAKGMAYGTNCPQHLLNVPVGKMSAFPDDAEHFLRWVHTHIDSDINTGAFVPRMHYGTYLEDSLKAVVSKAPPNITFRILRDEAVSLNQHPNGTGVTMAFASGTRYDVDVVVLAVGNYLPANPSIRQTHFYQSLCYVRNAWSPEAFEDLSPNDSVLLIGTGLTMVDKAAELWARGHQGKIHAISRHGLLPESHQHGGTPVVFDPTTEKPTTLALLRLVRATVNKAKLDGGNWQAVIDALRPFTQTLWESLPLDERKRFLRHVRPYWEIHRHRMPAEMAAKISEMRHKVQLEIHRGRIRDCEETSEGVLVSIRERGTGEPITLMVQKVINCTGPESSLERTDDRLMSSLLQGGLAVTDDLSLGLKITRTGALINEYGHPSERLFTLGSPSKGLRWESTAVPELRLQADNLAETICKALMPSVS
jgi:uncharacterized NAD(P)/FAD-binding protein YdhS